MKKTVIGYCFLVLSTGLLFFAILRYSRVLYAGSSEKDNICRPNVSDTVNVLLFYHASDYFIYRGAPIGFQYDLLKCMAKALNKKIFFTIELSPNAVFEAALTNRYDIVSMDFDKSNSITDFLLFSIPHSYSYPVIIQRRNSREDSSGVKQVHVPSRFATVLSESYLDDKSKWEFVYHDSLTMEELVEDLHNGNVDYVAADYHIAITLTPFYPDLIIGQQIGDEFARTWTLNSCNDSLNEAINMWLIDFKQSAKYKSLYKKYFSKNSTVIRTTFSRHKPYNISPYDAIIKKYSKQYNIDWRFVSSVVYQETKFFVDLEGLGGSYGIMQLMPVTGERYGVSDTSSIDEQLQAGIRHLAFLRKKYNQVRNETERYYFVAAAYNAGTGHIQDAQALCEKYGGDCLMWGDVSKYLKLKSNKQYYLDPVIRCGYFPGSHAIMYANQVMERYNHYLVMTHGTKK